MTLAFFKVAPIPALGTGVLLGSLVAVFTYGYNFNEIITIAHGGYKVQTGIAALDSLLNRGGVSAMTWTITLVMFALAFGGALERTRCLEAIVDAIMRLTNEQRLPRLAGI